LIYLDTSIVVSLLCTDTNSTAAAMLMQEVSEPVLLTSFAKLETVNALHLRLFRKEIAEAQLATALGKLEVHIRSRVFPLLPLPETAFRRAEELSRMITPRLGARAADLLHVAAALELGAGSFFSFDRTQRRAAEAARLSVNPWP
jgi:predicted nucleic acid-binding protein